VSVYIFPKLFCNPENELALFYYNFMQGSGRATYARIGKRATIVD
jgi:hypothetical protein